MCLAKKRDKPWFFISFMHCLCVLNVNHWVKTCHFHKKKYSISYNNPLKFNGKLYTCLKKIYAHFNRFDVKQLQSIAQANKN